MLKNLSGCLWFSVETGIEVSGKEKLLFGAGEVVEGWREKGEDFGDNKDMIMCGGYAESGPNMEERYSRSRPR